MPLRRTGEILQVAAAAVLVVAGLKLVAPLLVPLLLAAVLATASSPIALYVRRKGAPAWAGPVVAVLVDVLVVAGVVVLLISSMDEFQARLPSYTARLLQTAQGLSRWLSVRNIQVSPEALYAAADPGVLVGFVGGALTSVAALFTELVLVVLVVFFVLFEVTTFRNKLRSILRDPDANLGRLELVIQEVQRYLLIKTVLSLLVGALTGVWLALFQMDFTIVLALASFFLNFIPNLGSLVAAVPAVMIALVQHGPGTALGVAVGYGVVHLVVGSIVEPRVLGHTLGLSPLVVLLSMIFWGWLWGPVGALLSVPLTMIVKIVLSKNEDFEWVAVILGPPRQAAGDVAPVTRPPELLKRMSRPSGE